MEGRHQQPWETWTDKELFAHLRYGLQLARDNYQFIVRNQQKYEPWRDEVIRSAVKEIFAVAQVFIWQGDLDLTEKLGTNMEEIKKMVCAGVPEVQSKDMDFYFALGLANTKETGFTTEQLEKIRHNTERANTKEGKEK